MPLHEHTTHKRGLQDEASLLRQRLLSSNSMYGQKFRQLIQSTLPRSAAERRRALPRTGMWIGLVVVQICLALWNPGPLVGAEVQPREFGFDLPAGEASQPDNELVLTAGSSQQPTVAKTYVQVGDHRIVLLPDGQLVAKLASETTPTDRPFVPATVDALLQELTTGPFRSFRGKKTKHYAYVYNTSDNFALVASRILESMIPGMLNHARQQKIEVHEPEVPLVAIMFRTEREFQAYRRMPRGVVAYYDIPSNHIVMYEESELYRVKPDLAIQESISTIAHEGAHQILHNIGVQHRLSRWPMWLSEGLAEYYAPTSFGKNLRWKGAGQVNDMRMLSLELFLKGRDAETPTGQMIEHTVAAARLTSTGYATSWSLVHYLAKTNKENFHAYLRETSRLGPFEGGGDVVAPGVIPVNLERFKNHFGSDLAKLESGLINHLRGLPYSDPFADQPHYVAKIEIGTGRRARREANLFHSANMANKWVGEFLADLPEEQRSQARQEIQEFPNRPLADRSARQFLGPGR